MVQDNNRLDFFSRLSQEANKTKRSGQADLKKKKKKLATIGDLPKDCSYGLSGQYFKNNIS